MVGSLSSFSGVPVHQLHSIHVMSHQYSPKVLWNKLPEMETPLDWAVLWTHLTCYPSSCSYPKSQLSDNQSCSLLCWLLYHVPAWRLALRKPHRTHLKGLKLQVWSGENDFHLFLFSRSKCPSIIFLNNWMFIKYCIVTFDYWAEWTTRSSIYDTDVEILMAMWTATIMITV